MRNDDHLIFEGYKNKRSAMGLHFGMSDAEYNGMEEKREKAEHKQFKKDYKKAVKSGDLKTKSEDAEDYDWNDREESDYDSGSRRYRGNGRYTDYRTGASHRDDQGPDDEDAESLSIHPGDWAEDYNTLVNAINHLKNSPLFSHSEGNALLAQILSAAESIGYNGEGIGSPEELAADFTHLATAVRLYNEKGVQDS